MREVAALATMVAAGLVARRALGAAWRDASPLGRVLEPYNLDKPGAGAGPDRPTRRQAVLSAIDAGAPAVDRAHVLPHVQARLDDAAVPLRAAEALGFTGAAAAAVATVTLVATRSPLTAILAVAVVVAVPPLALRGRVRRRNAAFRALVPDMLRMLAGALRSGFSFMQALQSASSEVQEPMAGELRRALAETRLGRSVEQALEEVGTRMGCDDFRFVVQALGIQREVGGNLAALLYRVADTMVDRDRLRRDVQVLTAEGRLSGIVLAVLPVGVGALLYLSNRAYIGVLFSEPMGRVMLAGAGALALAGFLWIRKTTTVTL